VEDEEEPKRPELTRKKGKRPRGLSSRGIGGRKQRPELTRKRRKIFKRPELMKIRRKNL
jgi:hypothetical protein